MVIEIILDDRTPGILLKSVLRLKDRPEVVLLMQPYLRALAAQHPRYPHLLRRLSKRSGDAIVYMEDDTGKMWFTGGDNPATDRLRAWLDDPTPGDPMAVFLIKGRGDFGLSLLAKIGQVQHFDA